MPTSSTGRWTTACRSPAISIPPDRRHHPRRQQAPASDQHQHDQRGPRLDRRCHRRLDHAFHRPLLLAAPHGSQQRRRRLGPKSGEAFNSGCLYCISPAGVATAGHRLKCAGVSGSLDATYVYDSAYDWFDDYYHFAVYFSGFDLNDSGTVDSEDVHLWFLAPVDFDEDADADLDDLELLETEAGF